MSRRLDPRTHAYRPDVAASALAGKVAAARFVDGAPHTVVAATAPVHAAPDPASECTSELLYGESFIVYDVADGWAWGQGRLDDYVGYVAIDHLAAGEIAANCVVSALSTHVYPAPDLKQPPRTWLPLGARLAVDGRRGGFARLIDGGFVYDRHLRPIDQPLSDFVATAARYGGTPYLWGGRSPLGVDCSGLVQIALQQAAIACPRDSDMMAASLGEALAVETDPRALRRGDVLFVPRHVVFVVAPGRVLHANAHHMAVVEEPITDFLGRLSGPAARITAIRRLDPGQ